jgi:acyl-CoA reductase-like NAD-dependent aldehyde dehydrogenase
VALLASVVGGRIGVEIKFEMTIGGKRMVASQYTAIRNPATGDVVGHAAIGDVTHLDRAIAAAEDAFNTWRWSSDLARREACRAIAEVCVDNAAELAALLTLEQGKPLKGLGSEFELAGCAAWANGTADLSLPVKVLQDDQAGRIEMHRVPIGVIGSITPWNWPLMIAIWHIVPAIRTGNTVVIKPSPFTPLSTLLLVRLINEVLPAGVVNVISGGDELGAALSRHPTIRKMVFTGSTTTGRKVMASAAASLKLLTLELGGNDAGIVLPDADPKAIAERLFWGAFINSGQTCGALKRLYVHDSIYSEICDALVDVASGVNMGDGMDPTNVLGPIQNERQFNRIIELVEEARASGATILTGGRPHGRGYFYPVTLVANIEEGTRLVDEEQFGPVLPIIRYSDVDDAVRRANGTDYGLDASVWGNDQAAVHMVVRKLEAGTVWVNKHAEIAPHVPMGGIKSSGIGVEFGEEGLAAYTNIKIINATF